MKKSVEELSAEFLNAGGEMLVAREDSVGVVFADLSEEGKAIIVTAKIVSSEELPESLASIVHGLTTESEGAEAVVKPWTTALNYISR